MVSTVVTVISANWKEKIKLPGLMAGDGPGAAIAVVTAKPRKATNNTAFLLNLTILPPFVQFLYVFGYKLKNFRGFFNFLSLMTLGADRVARRDVNHKSTILALKTC